MKRRLRLALSIIASAVFAAASDSLRKSSDMSRLQLLTVHPQSSFAGPIRVCVSSVALVSLFHRSVANSFRCCDATGSDSLLLPRVQCCLKGCLAVLVVYSTRGLALQTEPYFLLLVHMTKTRKKTKSSGQTNNTLQRAVF